MTDERLTLKKRIEAELMSYDGLMGIYLNDLRGTELCLHADEPFETELIEGYIDGHNIDFLKNRVAFDLEWNSKDQTFDRDLMAMRTYFDCGLIDVGVIVTRAEELNDIFRKLGIIAKYGASTTWMGKLLPRLKSRRNGGCPILAVGIKKPCVEGDFDE